MDIAVLTSLEDQGNGKYCNQRLDYSFHFFLGFGVKNLHVNQQLIYKIVPDKLIILWPYKRIRKLIIQGSISYLPLCIILKRVTSMKIWGLLILISLSIITLACSTEKKSMQDKADEPIHLSLEQAEQLLELPLACLGTEYPNKLGQTLGGKEDIAEPHVLHPAFFGCFDWHSSVHGYWSLVHLLKQFPELTKAEEVRHRLTESLSMAYIRAEVDYFQGKHSTSYERTYGWAWLLKLANELHTWEDPLAKELEIFLQPLTDLIVQRYMEFLPKLNYPIRVGEHSNTAFGLSFAWDYAQAIQNEAMLTLIESRARDYYLYDVECPLQWEPSGYDFLSPCLEEIDLMRRILDPEEFRHWIDLFMPELKSANFKLPVGEVSDRSDGKLVHLDGLNFSRAWVLYGLAGQYPEYGHLIRIANEHVNYSLPNLVGDGYEGGHWLGSFAVYALNH